VTHANRAAQKRLDGPHASVAFSLSLLAPKAASPSAIVTKILAR
jgi:hypothetical protein